MGLLAPRELRHPFFLPRSAFIFRSFPVHQCRIFKPSKIWCNPYQIPLISRAIDSPTNLAPISRLPIPFLALNPQKPADITTQPSCASRRFRVALTLFKHAPSPPFPAHSNAPNRLHSLPLNRQDFKFLHRPPTLLLSSSSASSKDLCLRRPHIQHRCLIADLVCTSSRAEDLQTTSSSEP